MKPASDKLFMDSPIGWLSIEGDKDAVWSITFTETEEESSSNTPQVLMNCSDQLRAYFEGSRKTFDVPLRLNGTPFQQQVWALLAKIPFGRTLSYRDIAKLLGNEGAVRAVGMANSKNPLAIILPCHRVIGTDGQLIGYAGGIWRKKWLLAHEMKSAQGSLFE
jgi:methylated-DNA-[protein]-cysteine S-methyltransferase